MAANKLKVQGFRTNDLSQDTGKQFELGKSWCDFFGIDENVGDITFTLEFKPISKAHEYLKNRQIELQLSGLTPRKDRKAYANGSHSGHSAIKEFFLEDLQLTSQDNFGDYFAIYKASELNYYLYYIPKLLHDNFIKLFESITPTVTIHCVSDMKNNDSNPLQQIFYGAPGTGKSYKMEQDTKGYAVVRTTFHPDSDYSTFVGAYKPVMEDCDVKVTPIVTNNGVSLQPSGTYKERRIAYKYVKQAFLKAYLGAWKKYAERKILQISIAAGNGDKWILKSVNEDRIDVTKESLMETEKFKEAVKKYWNKSDNKVGNTEHWVATACKWYSNNYSNTQNSTADDCWNAIEIKLNAGEIITEKPISSQYYIKKGDNGYVIIYNANQGAKRNTIEELYNENNSELNNSFSIQASIARKLKEFSENNFKEAWEALKNKVNNNIIAPQFLVIEEINRGNCAQIFGDLFQLLDRSDNGFSSYPIEADTDLQLEVARAFKEDKEYKLSSNISIEGAVKDYTSNYDATLSNDVQEGRILLLPPNLYIWATMNTSDQSLFPIDSAFKRRWDWVYIPIKPHDENYMIEIGDSKYDWWRFLEKINQVIDDVTSSEDKKLGYFFVKSDNKVVDANKFVGKVLFYLWNDVFKNYGFDNAIFSRKENNKFSFSDFFTKDGSPDTKVVNEFLVKLDETIDKEHSFVSTDNNAPSSSLLIRYNGETIEGNSAVSKYVDFISRVVKEKGGDVVANCLGADFTQTPPESTTRKYRQIGESGWYLATNNGVNDMKNNINKIKNLGVDVVIE